MSTAKQLTDGHCGLHALKLKVDVDETLLLFHYNEAILLYVALAANGVIQFGPSKRN